MRIIIAILGLCALVPATAFADEGSRADEARAEKLYLEAEGHYAAGRYEKAVALYEESYELSEHPQLLFNIANAYERLTRYGEAADYLRRYLESGRVKNRRAIRARIKRLRAEHQEQQVMLEKLAAAEAEEADKASSPEPEPEPAPAVRRVPKPSPEWHGAPVYKWWLGGGAIALAAAGVFGLASFSAGNQVENQCATGLCPASAGGDLAREQGFAIAADVSAVFGLAAVGYGGYLWWKQRDASAAEMAVAPAITADTLGVAIAGEF